MNFKSDAQIKKLAFAGLCTALILIATWLIKIPLAFGYANLGDAIIFASAALLGPVAGAAAAVGSLLADILAGYASYALITFVIKGAMGLIAGFCLHSMFKNNRSANPVFRNSLLRNAIVFSLCEVLMVVGYFFFEMVMYGAAAAASTLLPNLLQGVVGIVLGCVAVPAVGRLSRQLL